MGVEERNLGVEERNLGVEKRNLGVEERNLGVDDRNLGVQESNLGAEERNLGVQERNLIGEERNLGAEKRIEFCAGCIKDTKYGINSGSFLGFLFQVRTKQRPLHKWQDMPCGVALNSTAGYRLRNTITETTNVSNGTLFPN